VALAEELQHLVAILRNAATANSTRRRISRVSSRGRSAARSTAIWSRYSSGLPGNSPLALSPPCPNGPLIPEIHEYNKDAVYIPRTGQINAWDNPAWVKAIEDTKRKTLLMAGTLTSVCVSFPALSALTAGYRVFCIIDASGNWSQMATDITLARVVQAGAIPIDTYAVLCELMGTWNRADAMEFAQIATDHIVPPFRALIESYERAQNVQRVGSETKLARLERR